MHMENHATTSIATPTPFEEPIAAEAAAPFETPKETADVQGRHSTHSRGWTFKCT